MLSNLMLLLMNGLIRKRFTCVSLELLYLHNIFGPSLGRIAALARYRLLLQPE